MIPWHRTKRLSASHTYWMWLALLLLAFSFPSRPNVIFDGLPFSSRAEFVFLAVAFLTTSSSRRMWMSSTSGRAILLALLLIPLGLKPIVLFGTETPSFSACYVTDSTPAGSLCETSFADVFAPDGRTRWDQQVHFDPPDRRALRDEIAPWRIDFLTLDDRRFDATWWGDIDISSDQQLFIESSAPILITLANSGERRVDNGAYRVTGPVNGAFSLTFLGRQSAVEVDPFLRVEVSEGSQKTPLRSSSSSTTASALGLIADLSFFVLAVTLIVLSIAARRARSSALLLLLTSVVLIPPSVAGFLPTVGPTGNGLSVFAVMASALIFSGMALKRAALYLVGAIVAIVSVGLSCISLAGGWGESLLRQQGDDWTTYQQFAREILASGSLRAGEDVFYFQPGYRYLLFLSRLVFGPGDLLQGLLVAIPLVAISVWVGWRVIALSLSGIQSMAAGLAVASLTVMASSDYLIRHAMLGLSEPTAWLLGLAMLALWIRYQLSPPNKSLRIQLVIGFLAGVATAVRPNYGLALLTFIVVAATSPITVRKKILDRAVLLVSGFAIPVLLVLAHNVWFGGSWTVVPSGVGTVYDFPPSRLLSALSSGPDRSELLTKIGGIAGIPRDGDGLSSLLGATVVLSMYASWLLTLWASRKRINRHSFAVLFWPWMFLPAMVLFDIWIYYPRHVVGLPLFLATTAVIRSLLASANQHGRHLQPISAELT